MVAPGRGRSGSARSGRDPAGSSVERHDGLVEPDEQRAGRHRARGLRLRARQGRAGSATGDRCARRSARRARRRRFPSARPRPAARTGFAPAKRRLVVDGAQRAGGDLDVERRARIPAPERPGRERRRRPPDQRGQVEDAIAARSSRRCRSARPSWRPARDRPRPRGIAAARDRRSGRQVEHDAPAACRAPAADASTGRGIEEPGRSNTAGSTARVLILRVGPSAMRVMRCSLGARIGRHGDHVAGLELDAPRRQLELGAFAAGPQILQPGIGEALRLGAAGDDGAVRPRLARGSSRTGGARPRRRGGNPSRLR